MAALLVPAHSYFEWNISIYPAGVIFLLGEVLAEALLFAGLLVLMRYKLQIGSFFVVLFAASAVSSLLTTFVYYILPTIIPMEALGYWGLMALGLIVGSLPFLIAMSGLAAANGASFRGIPTGGLITCILMTFFYSSYFFIERTDVFVPNYSYDEEAQALAWEYPDPEEIYPLQPEILAGMAKTLADQVPGQIDLYSLVGAGYPEQQVFQREVTALSALLERRFEGKNRFMRLGASFQDASAWPLLNRTNLNSALQMLAQKMDTSEDVLLLYLTSHGRPGSISTRFSGLSHSDLTASEVATALDASGIQKAVVVISACYSGSFVEDLAGPKRLILTASASDRNSFGCSDENEFTDWGRAFVAEALAQTHNFLAAAEIARDLVASREAEAEQTPSLPQISAGEGVSQFLQGLSQRFELAGTSTRAAVSQ